MNKMINKLPLLSYNWIFLKELLSDWPSLFKVSIYSEEIKSLEYDFRMLLLTLNIRWLMKVKSANLLIVEFSGKMNQPQETLKHISFIHNPYHSF